MINTDTDIEDEIHNGELPGFGMLLAFTDPLLPKVSLYDDDFAEGSIEFKGGITSENNLEIGTAVIDALNFTINNYDGTWDETTLTACTISPFLMYSDNITYKNYYITKVRTAGKTIRCEAMDFMHFLDKKTADFSTARTAKGHIQAIASDNGISLYDESNIPDTTFTLATPEKSMTQRQLLAYCAQLLGRNAHIQHDNMLHIEALAQSGMYIPAVFDSEMSTERVKVSGVRVVPYDTGDEEFKGTDTGVVITVSKNPFITDTNKAEVARNVYNERMFIAFHSGKATVLADPRIEPGDSVIFSYNGNTYFTCVTNFSYTHGLTMRIQSDIPDPETQDIREATDGALTSGGFTSATYTYAYTIPSSGTLSISQANLQMSTPSGYSIHAIRAFSGGGAYVTGIDPESTSAVMTIKGTSGQTGTVSLTVVYRA